MAHEFLRELITSGGLVTGGEFAVIVEDDLPRPSPSPAGTYSSVSVDQWGRVVGGSSTPAGVVPVNLGGTGSDLSATGPGLIYQSSAGAALAPVTSVPDLFTFSAGADFGDRITVTGSIFDPTSTSGISLGASSLSIDFAGQPVIATTSAPAIGFFGATPVAQQSGDMATGLVALGLFSSASGGGGGTPILEQVWAYLAANNSDPIDHKITSGNYVVFIYLASQNANAWKDATNAVHTVTAAKTLTVLQRFSVGTSADTARDGRLQNTTDATTVDSVGSDGRFGSAIPWVGDLATASHLPTVAAGKTVKASVWNSDANKRAFGVVYICYEA